MFCTYPASQEHLSGYVLKRQAPSCVHRSLPSATSTHSPPYTQFLNPSRSSQTYTRIAK